MNKEFTHKGKYVSLTYPHGTGNVGKVIKKGRFYEQKFLNYVARNNLGGTHLDVGANIGNHTVYFGLFTSADKVISFEPNPRAFKLLNKNVRANKLSNKVKTYNVAIGDKTGKCSIKINPTDEIGGASVVDGNDIDQWKLDKFIKENIKAIKIDVEGFEENVLMGAKNILAKHNPELFIEITTKKQFKNILELLTPYGYKPVSVFNNSATYHFSVKSDPSSLYNLFKFYPLRRAFRYS